MLNVHNHNSKLDRLAIFSQRGKKNSQKIKKKIF